MDDPLFERFTNLTRWFAEILQRTGISFREIREGLPSFNRAILEQIKAMEDAYFSRDVKAMTSAEENIKKFYTRAVDRLKKAA